MKKTKKAILIAVFLLPIAHWFLFIGFCPRTNMALLDYELSPDKTVMTIRAGHPGSAGYTRAAKNVSQDPAVVKLKFYCTFGGPNSSLGAKDEFVIELPPECTEIDFYRSYQELELGFHPVLRKNAATGAWERVGWERLAQG